MTFRLARLTVVLAVLAVGAALLPGAVASGFPVASDAARYAACGRVFPDPYAYWPSPSAAAGQSPWAKGNAPCRSTDFIGWDEALAGLNFMAGEAMFGDFVEVYNLGEDDGLEFTVEKQFADVLDEASGEGMTAGLPTEDLGREKVPVYMVRVTNEQSGQVAIKDREHFVYTLSLHGIERAGIEGGLRALEDLATWGSCEKHGDEESAANCAQEAAAPDNPHPILETLPEESLTAGEALRKSSVWFVLSNPDGWRRGDKQEGGFFYQRYNGNGMDMNRDWPTKGYTFRPYTPWSEPETRATGKALKAVKKKWTGGIDLHGQLIDRAFSFTLIGGSERPFDKDRRVVQFTKGAWADAEERLAWSSLIKPNDEPPSCAFVSDPTTDECDPSNRIYGVQWGTIWDTINYTVTGDVGSWIDSPMGLDGDGIDNEMSLSHLSNCGIGTCYIPEAEQLHVDGNKSLIYAMIHYSLLPEDTTFRYSGKAAYLNNPDRVKHAGSTSSTAPAFTKLPQQEPIETTIVHPGGTSTFEFDVKGPSDGVYNGAIRATVTWNNVQGVATGSLNELAIDRQGGDEPDPDRGEMTEDEWHTQNSYFNQSPAYLQGGAQIDVNSPQPGRYRFRVSNGLASTTTSPAVFDVKLEFLPQQGWPDPGQLPYDVSNMDFFTMLSKHVQSPEKLVKVSVADVASGKVDLTKFDTLIAVDEAFDASVANRVKAFARQGGNLVLTDDALRGLETMGVTAAGSVTEQKVYAGHVQFSADGGDTATYDDPLAANVNQPGAAEGSGHRHQVAEPVPTGFAIQNESGGDSDNHPQWGVTPEAFEAAKGRVVGTVGSGDTVAVTFGEIPLGDGVVRILGNLLPMPTEEFDHPFGLGGYAVTYSGYEVARNMFDWINPNGTTLPPTKAACEPSSRIPDSGFGDIRGNTHQGNIECIAWYGITSGTTARTYSPARSVTRDQMASYMAHLAIEGGVELPARPRDAFVDDERSIHERNINRLAAAGLVEGKGPRRYDPNGKVTRAQMATFIARVHKAAVGTLPAGSRNAFPDDNGNVHERNINSMASLGVVSGRNGRYHPREAVSRAQMATFVVHDLGHMVHRDKAWFGGADVTLGSTTAAPGGRLSGRIRSHKNVESFVADGCGNDNEAVETDEGGAFSVTVGADQSEECLLTLTSTTKRAGAPGAGQRMAHRFTITVSSG